MSKFEINQKVYDYSYGWGKVIIIFKKDKITVKYPKDLKIDYTKNGRRYLDETGNVSNFSVLATKEYYLEDFTQEPQIDYTKYINSWGKFGNSKDKIEIIGILKDFRETSEGLKYFYPFEDRNISYEYFQLLSDEQLKIFGLQ